MLRSRPWPARTPRRWWRWKSRPYSLFQRPLRNWLPRVAYRRCCGVDRGAGGLISYGTSYTETYPRVPVYVDRILKGAKPAETAIEVFSKHQLVINLKTARELGLTVPADLLKRADRVIE